jgi:hypothetical protein
VAVKAVAALKHSNRERERERELNGHCLFVFGSFNTGKALREDGKEICKKIFEKRSDYLSDSHTPVHLKSRASSEH